MSLDACLTGREGEGAGVQEAQPGQHWHWVVATEVPKHGVLSTFIYAFSVTSVNTLLAAGQCTPQRYDWKCQRFNFLPNLWRWGTWQNVGQNVRFYQSWYKMKGLIIKFLLKILANLLNMFCRSDDPWRPKLYQSFAFWCKLNMEWFSFNGINERLWMNLNETDIFGEIKRVVNF